MPSGTEHLSDLARHVRVQDPDRFYAALFALAEKREALFALLAFDHELTRVRSVVSQPAIGEMRFQFGREVLEGIEAGRDTAHPVAVALGEAYRRHAVPLEPLQSMIDAHVADLYAPARNVAALEALSWATAGALHRVMAKLLGANEGALEAAAHAGTAWAVATRRVSEDQVPQIAAAELARAHYKLARASRMSTAAAAILPAALVPVYLRPAASGAIRRRMEVAKSSRLIRLLLAAIRGRI